MTLEKHDISYCRKVVFSVIALTIMIVSVYSNSFHCSWHFDDMPNIVENPRLHMENIDWESFKKALFSDRNNPHFPYRPVACLSFALNYYFGKLNVFGYHVVNLGIHLITAIFLFVFIYRTLEYLALTKRWDGDTYFVALLSTVLWAINPIQTQAVTYIVQRMASMAAMFYIMGMYSYLKARTAQTSFAAMTSYTLCILSFLLALGSKENAAMFPVSIFLYEAVIIQDDVVIFIKRSWKWMLLALGATLLIGASYFFFKTGKPYPDILSAYRDRPFTLWERLLTEPRVLLYYLSLLLYPMPNRLCLTHDLVISTSLLNPPTTLLSIAFILVLIGTGIFLVRKDPLTSFCLLFFFTNHVIESSIFPLEIVFEHRNYLPSMMFFIPLAIGIWHLIYFYGQKASMKFTVSTFLVLVLVGIGHSTYIRNAIWKTDESLWMDAMEKNPFQFRPYHNLGKYYQDRGLFSKAEGYYKKALSLKSKTRKHARLLTYLNMGIGWRDRGNLDKALAYFRKSQEEGQSFECLLNIGAVYFSQGLYSQAYRYLKAAQEARAEDPYLDFNLGIWFLAKKNCGEAIEYLLRASKEKKIRSRCLIYLGIAEAKQGFVGRAFSYFKLAIRARPSSVIPRLYLSCLLSQNREKIAIRYAKEAVSLLLQVPPSRRSACISNISKEIDLFGWPSRDVWIQVMKKGVEEEKLTLEQFWQHLRHHGDRGGTICKLSSAVARTSTSKHKGASSCVH